VPLLGLALALGPAGCSGARAPMSVADKSFEQLGKKCVHAESDPNVARLIASRASMDVCDEPAGAVQPVPSILDAFADLVCPSGFTSLEGRIQCKNIDRQIRMVQPFPAEKAFDDKTTLDEVVMRQGGHMGQASLRFETTPGNACTPTECEPVVDIEIGVPLAFLNSGGYQGLFCGYALCLTELVVKVAVREGRARSIRIAFDGLEHCALPQPGTEPDASWPDEIHKGLIESLRRSGPSHEAAVSRLSDYYARVWQLLKGRSVREDNGPECVPYPGDAAAQAEDVDAAGR
jgi:hypothetical protein